jgi:hypothetical protein
MSMVSGTGGKSDFRRWDCIERGGAATSGGPRTLAGVTFPLLRPLRGVRMTALAETKAHAELRGRLAGVTLLSLILDLLAAGAAWAFEHGHAGLHTYWDALFWTTTQMLTVSSSLSTPETVGGKILDVALELYAVVVVTSMAGTFASFFHHRSRERSAAQGQTS